MRDEGRDDWKYAIDIIIRIAVPIILGVGGYFSAKSIDHEIRLGKIESNRYTAVDAKVDQMETNRVMREQFDVVLKQLGTIRESMARINRADK